MNKTAILFLSTIIALFAINSYAVSGDSQKEGCPAYMKLGDIKGEAQSSAQGNAGPRPSCPKGQIPKQENGMWKCTEMGLTAPSNPQQANTNPPPRCPKGQLPKMDKGMWKCVQPGFAAPGNSGEQ